MRKRTTLQRIAERARIVLASAQGLSGQAICAAVHVSRPTVTLWLDRYEEGGLPGVAERLSRDTQFYASGDIQFYAPVEIRSAVVIPPFRSLAASAADVA